MEEVPGSEKFFPAQLVFLALGFLGPESDVIKALDVKQDARSNIQTPPKVSLPRSSRVRHLKLIAGIEILYQYRGRVRCW